VAVVLTTLLLLDSVVGQVAVDRDMLEHLGSVQLARDLLAGVVVPTAVPVVVGQVV
jgi:hypothetical protein